MKLGAGARGARRGSPTVASGTGPGARTPSPLTGRRATAWGSRRRGTQGSSGCPGPRPTPGLPSAHLGRERPHEPEPRSSRVAASTMAAILCPRPPLLSSLLVPPPAPRPPGARSRRSASRFRCAERKQRPEARSGGRAAGDGGGRLGPRPGRSRGHEAAAAGLKRAGAAQPAAMAGYARRPGVTPLSRARSLVIPDDDKLGDLEAANPFSFKEFLKTKNLSLSKEDTDSRVYSQEATRHSLGLDRTSPASQTVGYGLEYQQPFFEDPTGAGDLLDEDEDEEDGWNGAYLPSAMEQTHSSRVAASTSPCSTYVSFFSNPSELVGPESLPPWTLSDSDSRISPTGSPSADFTAHGESLGDRHLRTLQISYEALKDENSKLRRKLTEIQSFSETQTEMVRTLERKLEAKMIKEESDYHDLESAVQQVEQNLELMTKRAVKAENHVLKLRQEVSLLQAQVSDFKRENEALRSGQGASLTVVKQNTDVALQNLRVVMNNAHASIKQLVSGAETLNLVAEILKSIDRISEIKDQGEES
uniref:Endosome-associated-trafficking regulator 1 n=2 Tax=Bos TaxID=9903 RepID=A0A8B9YUI5_BOSMU